MEAASNRLAGGSACPTRPVGQTLSSVDAGRPVFGIMIEIRMRRWTKLRPGRLPSILMLLLALCMCGLPAMAGELFTDLGPPASAYGSGGWTLGGSIAPGIGGSSYTAANQFTVAGSGSFSVTQIDLAVGNVGDTLDTFYASIWTDDAGLPGAEVTGAYWSLFTTAPSTSCCSLVSETGITGVNLIGGQQYFMILGPLSLSDASWNVWLQNTQSVTGLDLYSNDGGSTWSSNGSDAMLGAFDIIGGATSSTPEPCTLLLFGTGLIGLLGARRRRSNR